MTVHVGPLTLDWLGYATVRIEGETGVVIYTDPGRFGVLEGQRPEDGDLVLVTHGEHYDPDGIDRVASDETFVLVHESVDATDLERSVEQPSRLPYEVERVREDESFVLGPLDLYTIPAHNTDGTPHPSGAGCGYAVTIDGLQVCWLGDTDVLPVHEELRPDVLVVPIGGTCTMDRHEAADLAERLRPTVVLPVHYDTVPAIDANAEAFAIDVARRGVPVTLEEP